MRMHLPFYINRFFLGGEINSFHGIKYFRYRTLYIFEPVFFILTILSSILVQHNMLKDRFHNFLLLFYLIQLILIISIYISNRNRVNRSFNLYILFIFTLFTSLSLYKIDLRASFKTPG